MEQMKSTLSALCCTSVMCTVLSILMPDGTVKRYAQFLFALAAMRLMLSPILQLLEALGEL